MASQVTDTAAWPIVLQLGPLSQRMSDEEFLELCRLNRDLRIERTSGGAVIVMPPVGGEASSFSARVTARLVVWAEANGRGIPFDSSGGFLLPNGAERSPDFAWVLVSRWQRLSRKQQQEFPPLCPDFVIEIRSPSDRLVPLQQKMREYLDNGASLGWLIDPLKRKVYVYRPDTAVGRLDAPKAISGDPLLPGCRLKLEDLWP